MINCSRHQPNFLGLALHTCVLNDVLIELEEWDHIKKTNKVSSSTRHLRRIDTESLFPVSEKDRADFTKLAANLKYYLPEELSKLAKSRKVFAREHEYQEYEFYGFFENFFKHAKDAKQRIAEMEQVGGGTVLPDHHPLIEFLSSLNSYALSRHNMNRGGCF